MLTLSQRQTYGFPLSSTYLNVLSSPRVTYGNPLRLEYHETEVIWKASERFSDFKISFTNAERVGDPFETFSLLLFPPAIDINPELPDMIGHLSAHLVPRCLKASCSISALR